MKKIASVLISIALIVSFAACNKSPGASGSKPVQEDKKVNFRFGLTFNIDDYRAQDAVHFTKLVTERSGGTITFDLFPSEQLVQGRESLQSVSQGIIDMYMVGSTYIGGLVPSVIVYDLPQLAGRDLKQSLQFGYEFVTASQPVMEKEFKKAGVELVGAIAQSGTTEMIFRTPVRTTSDYSGKKVRTVGGISDQILQNLGSSPVFIGSADVYLGLQTGVVDGSMTTATTILGSKLYEICPYLTQPTISSGLSPYFLMINEKQWASLSDKQREIMKKAAGETLARTVEVYPDILNRQRNEALQKFKEVITLSGDEFATLSAKAIAPVWDTMLKDVTPVTKELSDMRRKMELGQ